MARLRHFLSPLLIACCTLWLGNGKALAQDQIAVIISSQAPSMPLDSATLRAIYLKKIFLNDRGDALIPVNLPAKHPLRQAFTRVTMHMSDSQLRSYWNRRYFQGISPPYVLASQEAVVRFVASTPGAVGYIHPCYLNASVRLLMLLPANLPDEAAAHCPS